MKFVGAVQVFFPMGTIRSTYLADWPRASILWMMVPNLTEAREISPARYAPHQHRPVTTSREASGPSRPSPTHTGPRGPASSIESQPASKRLRKLFGGSPLRLPILEPG